MNERDDILLSAWLDGELAPAERKALEERLEREPELLARLEQFRELSAALDDDPALPAGFLERTGARFRAEHPPARKSRARWGWAGLAAAAILLAAIVLPREGEIRELTAPAVAQSENELSEQVAADPVPDDVQAEPELQPIEEKLLSKTREQDAGVGREERLDATKQKKEAEAVPPPAAPTAAAPRKRAPGAAKSADADRAMALERQNFRSLADAAPAAVEGTPLPGGDALAAERSWLIEDAVRLQELSGATTDVAHELLAPTGRVLLVRGTILECRGQWRSGTVVPTLVLAGGPTTRSCAFPVPPGDAAIEVVVEGARDE